MERIKINLATLHVKKTRGVVKWVCYFLLLVVLAAGVYEAWYFTEVKKSIRTYKNKINKQAREKTKLVAPKKVYSDKELKELKAKIQVANEIILGDYFQCSILLDRLESAMPKNLFLNKIDVDLENRDNRRLRIEADAQNFDDIVAFVNNLENAHCFANPFLLSQSEENAIDGEKHMRFNVTTDIPYPLN
jgi:Tfp pilus assembly protein PilN